MSKLDFSLEPVVLDEAAVAAMTDDEFADALVPVDGRPVILSAINPETGEEMRAYAVPLSDLHDTLYEPAP